MGNRTRKTLIFSIRMVRILEAVNEHRYRSWIFIQLPAMSLVLPVEMIYLLLSISYGNRYSQIRSD